MKKLLAILMCLTLPAFADDGVTMTASITTSSAGTITVGVKREGEYMLDVSIEIEGGKVVSISDTMQVIYQIEDVTDANGNRTITVNY